MWLVTIKIKSLVLWERKQVNILLQTVEVLLKKHLFIQSNKSQPFLTSMMCLSAPRYVGLPNKTNDVQIPSMLYIYKDRVFLWIWLIWLKSWVLSHVVTIRMSHWCHMMVDVAEFWISHQLFSVALVGYRWLKI